MAWLRLYDDILDEPKIQMLPDQAFRMLINLWCLAKRNNGILVDDINSLAFSLRWPAGRVKSTLKILVDTGLVDACEGGFEPHNWSGRQFESDHNAAERMRRYRARNRDGALRNEKRNVLHNSDVLYTETETETETEQKVSKSRAPKKARSHKTSLPDNFPSEPEFQDARKFWFTKNRDDLCDQVAEIAEGFRDHAIRDDVRHVNWDAAWRTWYCNALKFNKKEMNGHGRRSAHDKGSDVAREIIAELDRMGAGDDGGAGALVDPLSENGHGSKQMAGIIPLLRGRPG